MNMQRRYWRQGRIICHHAISSTQEYLSSKGLYTNGFLSFVHLLALRVKHSLSENGWVTFLMLKGRRHLLSWFHEKKVISAKGSWFLLMDPPVCLLFLLRMTMYTDQLLHHFIPFATLGDTPKNLVITRVIHHRHSSSKYTRSIVTYLFPP
jgi:hypothetical protein